MADFLRGSFFRPLKLGRASCGGPSLPPAHIPAAGSGAKLASLPECSLLLCSFCCLALCLFPSSSLTFLPHLPCGRVHHLRDLTHQIFLMFLLSSLSAWETELSQPKCCQIEAVGECGREEARKEICERERGPSPLAVLRNAVPSSTSFRSVTIRSSSEDGIMSPLDFTRLLLQFFNYEEVSVSTRSH